MVTEIRKAETLVGDIEGCWRLKRVVMELSGVMKIFSIFICVAVTRANTYVKNYQDVPLRFVHLLYRNFTIKKKVSWFGQQIMWSVCSKETLINQKPEKTSCFLAVYSVQRVEFFPFSILWAVSASRVHIQGPQFQLATRGTFSDFAVKLFKQAGINYCV